MKNDISININPQQLIRGVSGFMHRYHVLIFSIVVLGGLSAATFSLYQTVTAAQTVEPGNTKTTFDSETITNIRELRTSEDTAANLTLPSGRTNPFQE